jgi:ferritin-like metal-binding protein YciE
MSALNELFIDELKDMYDAEHRITKALPKMAKAATDEDLKQAFSDHLQETLGHIAKLEKVFDLFGEKPKRKTCKATVGLLEEGAEIMEEFADSPAINAALISAGQKVEHYEIASYGSLREWAGLLDNADAVKLLGEILAEEEAADEKLTEVAESVSNDEALAGAKDKEEAAPARGRR